MRALVLVLIAACGYQHGGLSGDDGDGGVIDDGQKDGAIDAYVIPRKCTLTLGSDHSCSIRKSDSTVWCVGQNYYGELGNGGINSYSTSPMMVAIGAVQSAASRSYHTCASFSAGSVQCWGYNDRGQIDASFSTRASPVTITGLVNVVDVAVGRSYSCAQRGDGTVTCWGEGTSGQLGDGGYANRYTPTADVVGLTTIPVRLAPGGSHMCVQQPGATAQCWGSNAYGQLGDGTQTASPTAIAAPVTGIAQIATSSYLVGSYTGAQTCAMSSSGTIQCWGSRDFGQLGNGEFSLMPSLVPVSVTGITDAQEIAMGRYHACARRTNGAVSCWGRSEYGQIGDGLYENKNVPTPVTLPRPAIHIALGGFHTCALLDDQSVYCWGLNASGQLSDGTNTSRPLPVASTICP